MTLILALGNTDQVIQLSDRRVSSHGDPTDEEYSKAGILHCANARLAFGFTGLAHWGAFRTQRWLCEELSECGPPDFMGLGILQRLTERATRLFAESTALRNVAAPEKRLSIMFTGYLYHADPPLLANAIVTNFQTYGHDSPEAQDEFSLLTWAERRPNDGHLPTFIQRVGVWPAMTRDDELVFRTMLSQRMPSRALVGKGVSFMRELSARPRARNTVGQQITSICIPRDPTQGVSSAYHTAHATDRMFMADTVIVLPDRQAAFQDIRLERIYSPTARPFMVPHVRRNQPCPCGSGKKYKRCHGGQAAA